MKYTLAQLAAITGKMKDMGNSFEVSLAETMEGADVENLLKLRDAFPEIMDEYWSYAEDDYVEAQCQTVRRLNEEIDSIRSGDMELS